MNITIGGRAFTNVTASEVAEIRVRWERFLRENAGMVREAADGTLTYYRDATLTPPPRK
jgi:hypothetical protein